MSLVNDANVSIDLPVRGVHVGIDYDVRIVGFLRVTACVCVIVLRFVSYIHVP